MQKFANYLKSKEALYIIVVALLFVIFSYLGQTYAPKLKELIEYAEVWGAVVYIIFLAVEVIFAPITSLPIIPLAAGLFGSFNAAILSIIGWTIGSQIAFIIARKWGKKWVAKIADISKIEKISDSINPANMFLSLILLRITFPVDLLSYAVGMFTNMHWFSYLVASIIGVIPFAFVFAYAAGLPIGYQIAAGILALIALLLGYRNVKSKIKSVK